MHYLDGTDVKLGDKIVYNNQQGTVVLLEGESLDSEHFKIDEWTSIGSGLLIEFENGSLLKLVNGNDHLLRLSHRATRDA
ncbi:MAG TPA: hypothetical protein VK581_04945 [Chthoniobacterales bacterium]|nr:hypothetical protein [Chthoniobacterales bacterium]